MIQPSDVYSSLCAIAIVPFEEAEVLPLCTSALNEILSRLRDDVSEDNPLIVQTAAAVAYYNCCLKSVSEKSGNQYFKAGDLTVRNNVADEISVAQTIRDNALIRAADILKDNRFVFRRV